MSMGGLVVGENICITAWAGNIFSYVLVLIGVWYVYSMFSPRFPMCAP